MDLFALYVLSTKKTGNHSWENILQYKLLSETSMQLHIPHAICLRLEYNNDIVFQLFFFYIFSHLVFFPLLPPPLPLPRGQICMIFIIELKQLCRGSHNRGLLSNIENNNKFKITSCHLVILLILSRFRGQ